MRTRSPSESQIESHPAGIVVPSPPREPGRDHILSNTRSSPPPPPGSLSCGPSGAAPPARGPWRPSSPAPLEFCPPCRSRPARAPAKCGARPRSCPPRSSGAFRRPSPARGGPGGPTLAAGRATARGTPWRLRTSGSAAGARGGCWPSRLVGSRARPWPPVVQWSAECVSGAEDAGPWL